METTTQTQNEQERALRMAADATGSWDERQRLLRMAEEERVKSNRMIAEEKNPALRALREKREQISEDDAWAARSGSSGTRTWDPGAAIFLDEM